MTTKRPVLLLIGTLLFAACAKEPPPTSVTEFVENPIQLDAALIRCSRNRNESRYDPECMNAREAISRIESREEAARREELEKQSESKRRALRRTQAAAAEARRRAEQRERERREAEYLAQFGELPPDSATVEPGETATHNMPGATIPEAETKDAAEKQVYQAETLPSADGGNAPGAQTAPEEPPPSDLGSIRDELRRRNDEGED